MNGDDLSKAIEEGRAARRERAREAVALQHLCPDCGYRVSADHDRQECDLAQADPFQPVKPRGGEETRRARRDCIQPKPKVKGPRPKRFSWRKVDAISREIEVGIEDCRRDMPEVPEVDVAHDIAWSLLHSHLDEHPDTIRAVCTRYSIDYDSFLRRN